MREKFIVYGTGLGIPRNLMAGVSKHFDSDPAKAVNLAKGLPGTRETFVEYLVEGGISQSQAEKLCENPATLAPLITGAWEAEKAHGATDAPE